VAASEDFSVRRALIVSVLLAAVIAWLCYRLNRAFGDFLSDEGYLWYGVQRVMAGELPLRDFMSYEIGRYFFAAALLKPFSADGLLALRAVLGLVAGISLALTTGLAATASRESRVGRLLPAVLLFALWLVPRHKVFDIAISAVLVVAIYRLLIAGRPARYFQLGLATGLAAVIGQNHGLYALVASFLALGVLRYTRAASPGWLGLVAWSAGVVSGYLPVIIMALFVPGFFKAEYAALHYILVEYKGTNLPLPVPWPWTLLHGHVGLARGLLSLFFLALPVGLLVGAVTLLRLRRRGLQPEDMLFVASWAVAVPYANVAFSRADAPHLAQAILPFLLMLLGYAVMLRWSPTRRMVLVAVLLVLSLPVAMPVQPRSALLHGGRLVAAEVHGDRIITTPAIEVMLARARGAHGKGDVLAVPFYPGLSAALGERSPIWEIYPLFPRDPAFERGEIASLDRSSPAMIMVSTAALDGRPELAYPRTHPLTYAWIRQHYVVAPPLPGGMEVFMRSSSE
jgi:hypothetical protein